MSHRMRPYPFIEMIFLYYNKKRGDEKNEKRFNWINFYTR